MPSAYVSHEWLGAPTSAPVEQWGHALRPPAERGPLDGRIPSAFIKDCSYRTPDGFLPGCRRLRDLFVGKEVVGKPIKDCGEPPPYPDKRVPHRLPARREEYIHDSQTDLWYHCCENRPRGGPFSIEVDAPRRKKSYSLRDSLTGLAGAPLGGLLGGLPGAGAAPGAGGEEPTGPRLQCNLLENMKHRLDQDGGRMITDKVSSSAFGSATGLTGAQCAGDQAVALQRFAGGTKMRVFFDEKGRCVDTGPPGCATPMGKPYHVFRLAVPLPAVAGALLAPGEVLREPGWQRRASGGSRDFL